MTVNRRAALALRQPPVLHLSAAWGGLEKRNPLLDKLLDYEIPTSRKLELQPHATG
jgi:hypothetical protein